MAITDAFEIEGTPQIPENMTIKEWNQQRRIEIQSSKRTRFHRTQVDQASGVGKVRSAEVRKGTAHY